MLKSVKCFISYRHINMLDSEKWFKYKVKCLSSYAHEVDKYNLWRWWRTGRPGVLQSMGSWELDLTQWLNNDKTIVSVDNECTVHRGKWEKRILKNGSSLANEISSCKCCLREEHSELWIRNFPLMWKEKSKSHRTFSWGDIFIYLETAYFLSTNFHFTSLWDFHNGSG